MLEAFVGVWLFLSPWILGDYRHLGALINGMLLGGLVIAGSIASAAAVSATTEVVVDTHHWWGRVTMVIGAWLVVCSPLLDLDSLGSTVLNNVLVGVTLISSGRVGIAGGHYPDRGERRHSGRRSEIVGQRLRVRVRSHPQVSTITSSPSGRIRVNGPASAIAPTSCAADVARAITAGKT